MKQNEFWLCDVYTADAIYNDVIVKITEKFGERILIHPVKDITVGSPVTNLRQEDVVCYKQLVTTN